MNSLTLLLLFIGSLRTIQDVDFTNFTFPSFAGLKSIPVQNGDFCSPPNEDVCVTLRGPRYGDLTGDGLPEAVLSLHAVFRSGNGSHSMGFVYGLIGGQPRLLGRFAGGDRGNGGIIEYRIRRQRLEVLRMQASCAACSDATEEDVFKWNGRRLVLVSSCIRQNN